MDYAAKIDLSTRNIKSKKTVFIVILLVFEPALRISRSGLTHNLMSFYAALEKDGSDFSDMPHVKVGFIGSEKQASNCLYDFKSNLE